MGSIQRNFGFSLLTTLSQFVLPILILPYVARVLGPDNIGTINYASMIASYFVLLTTLGMNVKPQREIARCSQEGGNLSRIFGKYVGAQILASIVAFALFGLMIAFWPKVEANHNIYMLSGLTILASFASLEWFYRGLQLFNMLAWRAMAARIFLTSMVFIFVNDKNDILIYAMLLATSVIIPNIILLYSAMRMVRYEDIDLSANNFFRILKSMWRASLYSLFTSLYSMVPAMIYGNYVSSTDFGIFSVVQKVAVVILAFFGAFSSVMYPKQSELVDSDVGRSKNLINKSFLAIIPTGIFMLVTLSLTAKQSIFVIFGKEYERGYFILILLLLQTVIVIISQVYVNQILLPKGKEFILLKFAAFVSLLSMPTLLFMLNFIPFEGCAISTMMAEAGMLVLIIVYSSKYCGVRFPIALLTLNLLTVPFYVVAWIGISSFDLELMELPFFFSAAVVIFSISQILSKNPLVWDILSLVLPRRLVKWQ